MVKIKYFQALFILLFFSLNGIAQEEIPAYIPTELRKEAIIIDGKSRTFEYFVPKDLKSSSSLVFALHGSNGNVKDTRRFTNYEFERIASERKKQIIVYPLGYENHWNDCRMNASYKANQEDVNDIKFFEEMITHFHKKFHINKNKVFATGISNGGHMCYKLAYELPEKIKGIAPFVANLPEDFNNDCIPKNVSTSVLIINGTNDPINPYEGGWVVIGQDSTRGSVQSTEKTVAYWKSLLPCTVESETIEYEDYSSDDNSTVVHVKYAYHNTDKKVELIKVINGGHTVPLKDTPPIPERFKKIVGNKNLDINAPLIVVDFFESLIETTK